MVREVATPSRPQLVLPVLVFGMVEIRRLQRELESLDEYFAQNKLRAPGQSPVPPKITRLLDGLARENHIDILQTMERQVLANFLRQVSEGAPTVHISFAADPSAAFTAKIVEWLRANVHPYVLLQLGLQPSIAAGCVVRTSNHVFDFSLRQHFTAQRNLLLEGLRGPVAP